MVSSNSFITLKCLVSPFFPPPQDNKIRLPASSNIFLISTPRIFPNWQPRLTYRFPHFFFVFFHPFICDLMCWRNSKYEVAPSDRSSIRRSVNRWRRLPSSLKGKGKQIKINYEGNTVFIKNREKQPSKPFFEQGKNCDDQGRRKKLFEFIIPVSPPPQRNRFCLKKKEKIKTRATFYAKVNAFSIA